MDNLDNEKKAKNSTIFVCNNCNFKTVRKSNYITHLTTPKHQRITINNDTMSLENHQCHCGKTFKYKSGLCKHKHKCEIAISNTVAEMNNNEMLDEKHSLLQSYSMDTTIVIELLKQNQEFKDLMIEQSKQLMEQQQQLMEQQQQNHKLLEAVKDGKLGNTIIHNTNNNKFNLNFFLNETCKDAITMSDFINSIKVTMEDFIQTGNIGFVDGISKVMVERIKVMDLHTRPMHCTDLKRETLYIKNDDKWEKEDSEKTLLRKAVKNIANKNYNQLHKWYNNSKPQVEIIGSEDCENYFKYYKAALGGYDKEEDKKFEEKIIKNVLKEVLLDKMST
jgi:hypothetical protein